MLQNEVGQIVEPLCPICGSKLIISSQEMAQDLCCDVPPDDNSCVWFYTCPNCGSTLSCEECPDCDKHLFDFWSTN